MSLEDLDDWDEDFIKQAEEVIFSKSSANPTQLHQQQIDHQQSRIDSQIISTSSATNPTRHQQSRLESHSPPRELSQKCSADCDLSDRITNASVEKSGEYEAEIERLKRELRRQSEQVRQLEKDYGDLKRDRDKKNEQLKSVISQINARGVGETYEADFEDCDRVSSRFQPASTSIDQKKNKHRNSKRRGKEMNVVGERSNYSYESYSPAQGNVQTESLSVMTDLRRRVLIDSALSTSNEVSMQEAVLPEARRQPGSSSKAIGVQTDVYDEFSNFSPNRSLSDKLHVIWGSHSRLSGRDLVSKLFVTCTTDFHVLSRCISMNMPSQITLNSLTDESSPCVASHDHSVEAAKVSHLFFILTKMSNEMVQLDILFDALLDLCALPNVIVSHTSLRILHAILLYVLSLDIRPDRRDNVTIESMCPESEDVDKKAHTGVTTVFTSLLDDNFSTKEYFHVENLCNKEHKRSGDLMHVSAINWVLLFETLHRIAVKSEEESIREEALSIMNLIVMKSNPLTEREQFGSLPLYESVSQLFLNTDLHVKSQAVRLLFLLLNCPKILMKLCFSGERNIQSAGSDVDGKKSALTLQAFSRVLDGLGECMKCSGRGAQELKLCRRVIILLAFIASSGISGFEILLTPRIPQVVNFLGLIMQVLSSEMDTEPTGSSELSEMLKERTSMVREALILLNRLISSPIYSAAALGALTSSRDMTSLTLDVANRISRSGRKWRCNQAKNRKINSDIDDLARVFRSRIFTFLGAGIS